MTLSGHRAAPKKISLDISKYGAARAYTAMKFAPATRRPKWMAVIRGKGMWRVFPNELRQQEGRFQSPQAGHLVEYWLLV